ncbi:hypothetical protein NUW58_g3196 [Xylaria curta]|uniref:Uncharacterized protein n=1 Tax=Xylaria curta TaxID=42375 RepID=A0ACC1PCL6_9PEZI|nr:hypothetical protein NUW58_g3196 [Xylaria curta]
MSPLVKLDLSTGYCSKQAPIAVVGMACRLPGSCNNPTQLWDFLLRGGIASRTPPETRFNFEAHHDNSKRRNTMASPGGMFIDADPRDLDASFFRLPRSEAISMDPQQRQLLEVVYEGLENSGVTLEEINGQSIGCFVGSYACDYGDMDKRDPENGSHYTTLGTGRAMLTCSGALVGVDLANRYLQTGEISAAIVAGCNIYLSPEHVMDGLSVNGTASLSGFCHTFDAKADGYIKAEAVNMVFLKRLDDAIRDKNAIRAVIRGTATGSDGWTPGIASPNSTAQATTISQAYSNAGITDIGATTYIECHGTGTRAGDVIEATGIASIFSTVKTEGDPLQIGSVKSNVGHSEPAAGISGLLKVILAIENGIIPGNPTFETPNPDIDFRGMKVRVSKTATRWERLPRTRRAGVNSFGYGGSNAHIIVESGQELSRHVSSYTNLLEDDKTYKRPYLLALSANDEASLKASAAVLDKHISYPGTNIDFRDLAYTLSEKRTRHFHRGYIVTDKHGVAARTLVWGKPTSTPRVGLIFTGQGAQWPQMGKTLISSFPVARDELVRLDNVLRTMSGGPQWSLLDELSQHRSAEHYRLPEISQTLVTALQLSMLAVLQHCEVAYTAVVGHSSGEIAAAVAAGLLTPEQAIKIAYYRGIATAQSFSSTEVGMLAVGLGESEVTGYLDAYPNVEIACINSPENTTLAGNRQSLLALEKRLKAEGRFARMLLVDAAYHSKYMAKAALKYGELLENCEWPSVPKGTSAMFSSLYGREVNELDGADYWKRNLTSPVLFDAAVKEMLKQPLDLLVEIGPSNALSGPINQIKMSIGSTVEYASAWKRGRDALQTFCNLAGTLFVKGCPINLMHFNDDGSGHDPSMIVDLPNYSWNHSIKYWHESTASKDWRFRRFPHHDLLGGKVLGTPWHQPCWRKVLRTQDTPWLKDHRLGDTIVFPAAGYLAMAIEASFQASKANGLVPSDPAVSQLTYELRNCRFIKALVISEDSDGHELVLTLAPGSGPDDGWYQFNICMQIDDLTDSYADGLVRAAAPSVRQIAPEECTEPLQHPISTKLWYKIMQEIGYNFGPSFRKSLFVESAVGSRRSRSLLSFDEPKSQKPQSPYSLHPTSIDACFQAVAASIWAGDRTAVNARLVPDMIDKIVIPARSLQALKRPVVAGAISMWDGQRPSDDARSYASDVAVYDQDTRELIFDMHGLKYQSLEAENSQGKVHMYTCTDWRADISMLSQIQMESIIGKCGLSSSEKLKKLLDMVAFQKPNASVLEVASDDQVDSLWVEGRNAYGFDRVLCSELYLLLDSPTALARATSKYAAFSRDFLKRTKDIDNLETGTSFDIIICNKDHSEIQQLLQHLRRPGYVVLKDRGLNSVANNDGLNQSPSRAYSLNGTSDPSLVKHDIFSKAINFGDSSSNFFFGVIEDEEKSATEGRRIDLLHFSADNVNATTEVVKRISQLGWDVCHHMVPFLTANSGNTIVVLEEMVSPVLSRITESQWDALQNLLSQDSRILWVSKGAQMNVTNPDCSLVRGFARSISNENPSVVFMTLDVEHSSGNNTALAIDKVLRRLVDARTSHNIDNEFVERDGILHIARILPDIPVNRQQERSTRGTEPSELPLFSQESCVRLISNRPGTLESLQFSQVSDGDIPLPDGYVEVDIHAVSLNFKDLAVVMNLVPGNERLLGLDGAGVIRRVGGAVGTYRVGQRVLANRKGSFANRVQCKVDGEVFPIPDGISFTDAATLNTVYSTALYALTDISKVQPGHSVLIHSAAGGLGIAAVQFCIYLGAEIYATVGNNKKRQFLIEKYNIRPDRIFSSRDTSFATALMEQTGGKGVDVILNTVTGEMLHASWNCIATGGTFVDLGKKDMLEKSCISMEPFQRNAAYHGVDMSHESITLLVQIFELLQQGRIKPVIDKVFSFEEFRESFRLLGTGNAIGKIVIARDASPDHIVAIHPMTQKIPLRSDSSYVIVGGLRGICGSLAIYLAKEGAKSLVILARSGYDDDTSRKIVANIRSLGTELTLIIGDVTNDEDVDRVFTNAPKPVAGIIQGAMVLRDGLYSSMSQSEFHQAVTPKIRGSWSLHNAAIKHGAKLDFFTLLSSICGVVGQKGQANYSAANSFLDAFSEYRKCLGLPACSVDLGVVEDVGYVNERDSLSRRLLAQGWPPIDEARLHNILYVSILQQQSQPINGASSAQLITGVPVPLPDESPARQDARFGTLLQRVLRTSQEAPANDFRVLLDAFRAGTDTTYDRDYLFGLLIDLANQRLKRSLGMAEDIDPSRPIASYGIDSLVAVEFRNWARVDLGVEITTLDVLGTKTLTLLCDTILRKGMGREK